MRSALVAGLLALAVVTAAVAVDGARRHGPGWDDTAPDGHSRLVRHLADRAPVKILESSLALLPPEAGKGDVLFLFATHRPPAGSEADAVLRFARGGGLVVIAADGGEANRWLAPLGGNVNGIPVSLPPGSAERDCLLASFTVAGHRQEACLPSPTVVANSTEGRAVVGRLQQHIGIDLDGDGELGLKDQAPSGGYPVAVEWAVGEGRAVVVADGQVWSNAAVQAAPEALSLASLLAEGARTAYLDGSSHPAPALQAPLAASTRAVADPLAPAGVAFLLALAGLAVALAVQKRHAPWHPHTAVLAQADGDLLATARAALLESFADPAAPSPPLPTRPVRG